jgi:NTP pyrophosphatase (non-canonical NTP hydrolase)
MEKTEILALFNTKFGTSVDRRLVKLREEYGELMEAAEKDIYKNKDNLDDFIDELADLNAVVFHIAGILGLTQDELLSMAADKVVGRMKDPNYKRKHPHVSHHNNTVK